MARDIQLHYFYGRGIGEPIRLVLTAGAVAFTDNRYTLDEFAGMTALKAKLPFGQIPALEVDGVFLGQNDSLSRLAARLANLYPGDIIEAAKSDMIDVRPC
jgi:glutathione S-transferase